MLREIRVHKCVVCLQDLIMASSIIFVFYVLQIPELVFFGFTGIAWAIGEAVMYKVSVIGDDIVIRTIYGYKSMCLKDVERVIRKSSLLGLMGSKYILIGKGGSKIEIPGVKDDLSSIISEIN